MFVPVGQTLNSIVFLRNAQLCGQIGVIEGKCQTFALNPRYIFECKQDNQHVFTLTIPAENMTEYEQSSVWQCQYYGTATVSSPLETLTIASMIILYQLQNLKLIFFLVQHYNSKEKKKYIVNKYKFSCSNTDIQYKNFFYLKQNCDQMLFSMHVHPAK